MRTTRCPISVRPVHNAGTEFGRPSALREEMIAIGIAHRSQSKMGRMEPTAVAVQASYLTLSRRLPGTRAEKRSLLALRPTLCPEGVDNGAAQHRFATPQLYTVWECHGTRVHCDRRTAELGDRAGHARFCCRSRGADHSRGGLRCQDLASESMALHQLSADSGRLRVGSNPHEPRDQGEVESPVDTGRNNPCAPGVNEGCTGEPTVSRPLMG